MSRSWIVCLVIPMTALGMAACGGGVGTPPLYPQGGSVPGAQDLRSASKDDTTQGGSAEIEGRGPQPWILQPGDVVAITTIGEERQRTEGLVVDETGRIHVPLAGEVEVGGIPLAEAETRVQEALREYQKFARVTLTVTEPAGHRATVMGAVQDPGPVQLKPGMRLANLLAKAGGPLTKVQEGQGTQGQQVLADLPEARLYRDGEPVDVDLEKAVRGDPRHNIRVRPGDHLYVPPEQFKRVVVLGSVNGARVLQYRDDLRLSEALALAGGTTDAAETDEVRLVRGELSKPELYETSLEKLAEGEPTDVVLAPGDVVYVPRTTIADVGQVLDWLGPVFSAAITIGMSSAIIATR